ncbi:MAG: hypothetical protein OZ921_19220 [Sorangiineae bacterium]|nr:hypothetical protein [Sorangiineae bacterium]
MSRPGAWLELRDSVDQTPWRRACFAPCDARLRVDGMEARVAGPDLTTSNPFRIAPGRGTVRLAAAAGSPTARSIGTVGMIAGVPITLGGMGLYGYGRYEAQPAARTAGIVALAVGAITVLGSLPFLAAGSTTVRTADGKTIARRAAPPRF